MTSCDNQLPPDFLFLFCFLAARGEGVVVSERRGRCGPDQNSKDRKGSFKNKNGEENGSKKNIY